jgi:hypothetical protein
MSVGRGRKGCDRSSSGPMGALVVVALEVEIQLDLQFLEGLVPGGPALHPGVLVQERPLAALDEAVGLVPTDPGAAVLDAFELEEERRLSCWSLSIRRPWSRGCPRVPGTYIPFSGDDDPEEPLFDGCRPGLLEPSNPPAASSAPPGPPPPPRSPRLPAPLAPSTRRHGLQ